MKIKSAFFPFTEQNLPILRHFAVHNHKYEICEAITWSGTGVNHKDIGYCCNLPPVGIPASGLPEEPAGGWDALIVDWDAAQNENSRLDLAHWLGECLAAGKKLVLVSSRAYPLSSGKALQELYDKYRAQIEIVYSDESISQSLAVSRQGFRPLPVPVVLVGGLIKESSALEILFALKETLEKNGHTVSCLCDSGSGVLAGMHSYRHVLSGELERTEAEKIAALNQLAHDVLETERSELLLVEAPDAVIKYNYIAPNGFGIQTYMLSQALEPDFAVCCVPADTASERFLDTIGQELLRRYECSVIGFHVSNYVIDSAGVRRDQAANPVFTDLAVAGAAVRQVGREFPVPVFNVHTDGADGLYRRLAEHVLLSEGGEEYAEG